MNILSKNLFEVYLLMIDAPPPPQWVEHSSKESMAITYT